MSAAEPMEGAGARLAIWREAPSLEGLRTAAVGAFDCETPEAGGRLLRAAAARLREEGFQAVVGPMDGDTWNRHRLVVESDGRPPFLMEPLNPPHHSAAFDAAGWPVIARYASADQDAGEPRPAHPAPPALTVRSLDMAHAEAELRRMHALSLERFAGNFLYRPIGEAAFLAMYGPVLAAVDPELVLLAEDDEGALQAFLFAVPDRLEGEAPRSVVLKTYASRVRGGGALLVDRFARLVREKGYGRVIHALFHESNLSARRSEGAGGRVFRRYALWGLRL